MVDRFDPRAFLEVARQIAAEASSEARLRTAVSRGYYAAFLLARELTGTQRSRSIHRDVRNDLAAAGFQRQAQQLDTLSIFRRAADYHLGSPADFSLPATWERCWNRAEILAAQIIQALDQEQSE